MFSNLRSIAILFKLRYVARSLRTIFYRVFNLLGYLFFTIFRILHLVPQKKHIEINKVKRVLIIRLDRIGDVILSTPLFRAIRQNLPEAEITLLINSYTKDLVISNSWIDQILSYPELSIIEIIKKIIRQHFDLVLVLHDTFLGNAVALLSAATYKIGYDSNYSDFVLTHLMKDDRLKNIRPYVETNLDFARYLNFTIKSKEVEISLTEEGEGSAENFLKTHSLQKDDFVVCIHPGSRQPYIRWGREGFAEVADRLIKENNAKVVLIGNEVEKKLVEEIVSLMKEKPIIAVGVKLTKVISLIKRCSLFIGNSTGPMHIAAGLKVPVVAIFGSVHPYDSYKKWGPWGEGHIVVSKDLNCKDCHPGDCRTFDCMKLITVEDVLEAVDRQLQRIKVAKLPR